jgi:hypothetical protein
VAALVSAPAVAAGELERVALEAHGAHSVGCADVAGDQVGRAADALVLVATAYSKVHDSYESAPDPKPTFLLYWRGVLGQCLDRDGLAGKDLLAFIEAERDNAEYREQVRDARRRLRRLGRSERETHRTPAVAATTSSSPSAVATGPRFTLGAGGGYHRVQAAGTGWNYGSATLQTSIRLTGPLALVIGGVLKVSDYARTSEGDVYEGADGSRMRSLLGLVRVGVLLRRPGPIRPVVSFLFQAGPDPLTALSGAPAVVGVVVQGGLEFSPGSAPLALFVRGEVGFLSTAFQVGGFAGIQLAVP